MKKNHKVHQSRSSLLYAGSQASRRKKKQRSAVNDRTLLCDLQLIQNFFVFGETQCLVFAVDHFAVDFDIKNAPFARDQFCVNAFG